MTIDGKVVAITGASSGIGEATATLLAARDARLELGARDTDTYGRLDVLVSKRGIMPAHRPGLALR